MRIFGEYKFEKNPKPHSTLLYLGIKHVLSINRGHIVINHYGDENFKITTTPSERLNNRISLNAVCKLEIFLLYSLFDLII